MEKGRLGENRNIHGEQPKKLSAPNVGGRDSGKTVGSFSNDDGDSSENVKKSNRSKTTTLHVHHAFLYISPPPLQDYNVKMPNFTFYGGRKQATTNFSFSF